LIIISLLNVLFAAVGWGITVTFQAGEGGRSPQRKISMKLRIFWDVMLCS
jgi:hypothetical protein